MVETKPTTDSKAASSRHALPTDQATQPRESPPPKRKLSTRARGILGLIALIVIAAVIGYLLFHKPAAPNSIISLSGRIEGDDSAIAPKTGGRILEVRVREGDSVKAGDTIAVLDDQQIRAREDQARAALSVAEAKAKAARDQIAVLQEQWKQNNIQVEQARIDAQGRVRQAEAEMSAAEADLAQQEAAYQLALFDKEAYTKLAQTGAVAERKGKEAASTAAQHAAAVAAAKQRVEAARGALTMATANLANPQIRGAETEAVRKQIAQQQAEVASANASIAQARAQVAEAEANRKDLIVLAPFDATVTTRSAEPGEVVSAGTTIVTLLDLSKVYLRGYVPEGEIGNVKLEQPARVYLDSNPNQPIEAYVSRIDPEATFTPENTYFRDERVKQVVGVKLQLKGAIGLAKPGMPADGEILILGDSWPNRKRTT
ncbi:MAG TPA: HlyD family efflux transporter periplasmic adaptor subunit [Blastocatellia bacterium]|nr:HlyD family efflux transporter periplasmic adaptor subunit [Blastocatellia bacterium]